MNFMGKGFQAEKTANEEVEAGGYLTFFNEEK